MGEVGVRIERLSEIDRYHECESLQGRVWGLDGIDVVPLHLMITMQKSGGLVLGAFDETDRMVGFLLGFLGACDGNVRRPKHCSHMMGVLEEWRGRGVGYRLKLAQRDHALSQGLDLVTWTYDPLESLNAALNIGKLGAVCGTYVRDLYGPMTDGLNAGLSTDRFCVDWWIDSDRVRTRLSGDRPRPALAAALARDAVVLNPASVGPDGLPRPAAALEQSPASTVLVEIPANVRAIKADDMELAWRWREQTREAFEECFAAGYTVSDFISEEEGGVRRSWYVLERGFKGV
jgi:predicted GNAT superfamily acetyltransferase